MANEGLKQAILGLWHFLLEALNAIDMEAYLDNCGPASAHCNAADVFDLIIALSQLIQKLIQ